MALLTAVCGVASISSLSTGVYGQSFGWAGDGHARWSQARNWSPAGVPNAAGTEALFDNASDAGDPVLVDVSQTVGRLTFARFGGMRVTDLDASGGVFRRLGTTLTLATSSGTPVLHAVSVVPDPVGGVYVSGPFPTLDVTLAGTQGLTKTGDGLAVVSQNATFTGPVRVEAGRLQSDVGDNGFGSSANALVLAGGEAVFRRSTPFTVNRPITVEPVGGRLRVGSTVPGVVGSGTFRNALGGSGVLTLSGGAFTFTGTSSTFTGTILNDATLAFAEAGTLGTATNVRNTGAIRLGGTSNDRLNGQFLTVGGSLDVVSGSERVGTFSLADGVSRLQLQPGTGFGANTLASNGQGGLFVEAPDLGVPGGTRLDFDNASSYLIGGGEGFAGIVPFVVRTNGTNEASFVTNDTLGLRPLRGDEVRTASDRPTFIEPSPLPTRVTGTVGLLRWEQATTPALTLANGTLTHDPADFAGRNAVVNVTSGVVLSAATPGGGVSGQNLIAVDLDTGPRGLTLLTPKSLRITGDLRSAGLTKIGPGRLDLTSIPKSYEGPTNVHGGTVVSWFTVDSTVGSFGRGNAAIRLHSGRADFRPAGFDPSIDYGSGVSTWEARYFTNVTIARPLEFLGTTPSTLRPVNVGDGRVGTVNVNSPVLLGNGAGLRVARIFDDFGVARSSDVVKFNGIVSGGGSLVLSPGANVELNNANSYTGGTLLSDGSGGATGGGTVGIARNASFGTGLVTIGTAATTANPATIRPLAAGIGVANPLLLDGPLRVTGSHPLTWNGPVTAFGSTLRADTPVLFNGTVGGSGLTVYGDAPVTMAWRNTLTDQLTIGLPGAVGAAGDVRLFGQVPTAGGPRADLLVRPNGRLTLVGSVAEKQSIVLQRTAGSPGESVAALTASADIYAPVFLETVDTSSPTTHRIHASGTLRVAQILGDFASNLTLSGAAVTTKHLDVARLRVEGTSLTLDTALFGTRGTIVRPQDRRASVIDGLPEIVGGAFLDLLDTPLVLRGLGSAGGDRIRTLLTDPARPLRSSLADGALSLGFASASRVAAADEFGTFGPYAGIGGLSADDWVLALTLRGDTNLDGFVGASDFNVLLSRYGLASGATWADGDLDYDGRTGATDFNILLSRYGAILPAGGVTFAEIFRNSTAVGTVPEPGGLIGCILVSFGACVRRPGGTAVDRRKKRFATLSAGGTMGARVRRA